MKTQTLLFVLVSSMAVLVALGQFRDDRTNETYSQLQAIAAQQADAVNQTNRNSERISSLVKQGVELLNKLPLSDGEKARYLISHINDELLEIEKREMLIRAMLTGLHGRRIEPNQLGTIAAFLNRPSGGRLDAALFAGIMIREDEGIPVFITPQWGSILEFQLRTPSVQRGMLVDHLLEAAQRKNWNPDGATNWLQAAYHDQNEQMEIGAAAREAEKMIWARKYVRENLLKNEQEKKSSSSK